MKHWFCGVYFQPRKFKVEKGAEITQLICEGIFFFNANIEEAQVLDDTEKDSGGLCSTGKN